MELLDILWNIDQQRQLNELRTHVDRVRLEHDVARPDHTKAKDLAAENLELKLRLALLVRLLVTKGVITASEYAALIAESRAKS